MSAAYDITQAVKARGRGIARYIRQVVPPLAEMDTDLTLCIRGPRWFKRQHAADLAPQARRAWMPFDSWLNISGISVFHSFGNHLPAKASVPLSFTVHDVRALDSPAGYEGSNRLLRNIDRADGILCLTEYGRSRLVHHCPGLGEKVVAVVPHGVDRAMFQPQDPGQATKVAASYGLDAPFVLQLGSWFPHKNLELSIEAFARSQANREDFLLVFVGGGAAKKYRIKLENMAGVVGIRDRVRWLEHVPGKDLPSLLAASQALLQPSLYEGFALPLLESMAVGTPGVVSDSSCLAEVSAGIWPVAGQRDAEAFAAGIETVVFDSEARADAIGRGLKHASEFTWQRTAEMTRDFVRAVAKSKS